MTMTSGAEHAATSSPWDRAGVFGRLTFDYVRPLLRVGRRRPLQEADLPPIPVRDRPENTVRRVEEAWAKEIEDARGGGGGATSSRRCCWAGLVSGSCNCCCPESRRSRRRRRPSFLRALVRAFRFDFWAAAVLSLLEDASILVQVMLVRPLLHFLEADEDDDTGASFGYELASWLALASFLQAVIHHQTFYVTMRGGWNLRICVTGLLHAKLLRLSQAALHSRDSASVQNLIGSDVLRFDNIMPFLHFGWCALLVFAAVVVLLQRELGWAATVAGSTVMLAFIALQVYLGRQFGRRRRITARITDQRVRLTGELLSGVASVKAYAWEGAFLDGLQKLRRSEHRSIYVSQSMKACTVALYFAAPAISSLACFSVYVYGARRELKVSEIYSSIALLHCMRLVIGKHLAQFLSAGPECCVAIKRMEDFLLLPEVGGSSTLRVLPQGGDQEGEEEEEVGVFLESASFGRPSGQPETFPPSSTAAAAATTTTTTTTTTSTKEEAGGGNGEQLPVPALKNVTLAVRRGELTVVSGAVGTGKSTLLESILGELALTDGSARLVGRVSYSPQAAWIMSGSLQSNIVFGGGSGGGSGSGSDAEAPLSDEDAARLERVIDVCCLRDDIALLPDGLRTEIGEKGVNLSGGQKARVSLARACFARADVVLLDDPLSAVDPSVAASLFHGCVRKWLTAECRAAVVLVTHQRQFMRFADRLVLLTTPSADELALSDRHSSSTAGSADGSNNGGGSDVGSSDSSVGIVKAVGTFEELESRGLVHNDGSGGGGGSGDDDDLDAALANDGNKNDGGACVPPATTAVTAMTAVAVASPPSVELSLPPETPLAVVTSAKEQPKGEDEDEDEEAEEERGGGGGGGVDKTPVQLMKAEDRELGLVRWATWKGYLLASGGGLACTVLALFALGQVLLMLSDWWLMVWATDYHGKRAQRAEDDHYAPLLVFVALTVSTTAVSFARSLLFFFATLKASSSLHHLAATRLFGSPLSFFASQPHGRILNRFSSDLSQMDELLAVALFDTLQISVMCAAGLAIACAVLPPIAALVPPVLATMVWFRQYTTASMRELKRLDGTTRSPVYSFFSATLHGLLPIRAYRRGVLCQGVFVRRLQRNATAWYWWLIANRWFGFNLDLLCFLLVGATAFLAVALRDRTEPGLVGLALVYVLALSGMFQYMMRQSALVETFMTSVERISQYAFHLESEESSLRRAAFGDDDGGNAEAQPLPEDDLELVVTGVGADGAGGADGADGAGAGAGAGKEDASRHGEGKVDRAWPARGDIVIEDLRVRYRSDLPEVIHGMSAKIRHGTKVGVVGRTGSGKSSLLNALSRLNEICGGKVTIDGLDTRAIALVRLRQALAVIPQEPHLFSGSVRFNLDPFSEFSDAACWQALRASRLGEFVSDSLPDGLSSHVSEGGTTWSAGQRQLLSIARAILHRRRVVLLDEATASVDFESDQAIQEMLRSKEEGSAFKDATLIVIAHRIDTIIDSDQVLVMENGLLVEDGSPEELLAKGEVTGIFAQMVAASRTRSSQQPAPRASAPGGS